MYATDRIAVSHNENCLLMRGLPVRPRSRSPDQGTPLHHRHERCAEHLHDQLSAADITLEPSVLDRIDRIVAPGTDLNPDDAGYSAAVLADPKRHRRAAVR
ncbi:hypothetical protein [Nonomuraea sp. NPDC050202]|uniref:hypothetical protein n=1 Tax=Nonomuraea sp. NPDC050202 TaxID=3155035 RepID=UPI0033DAD995